VYNVLIVDDNPSDRQGIQEMIDWEQLEVNRVEIAANGLEGIRKIQEVRPDIIITDVSMPQLDGIRMIQHIKEELPDVKVIFMSCFDEFEYVKHAISLEAFAYVLKPIELEEMMEAISKAKTAIERQQMNQQTHEQLLKLREQLPQLREQFFQELLFRPTAFDQLRENIQFLDIPFVVGTSFCVLEIAVDLTEAHAAQTSVENRYLQMQRIRQEAEHSLFAPNHGYVLHQNVDTISLLVLLQSETGTVYSELFMEQLVRFHEKLQDQGHRVTIGVSQLRNELLQLSQSWEEAGYAVSSNFFDLGHRIIMASEIKATVQTAEVDLQQVKQEIASLLEQYHDADAAAFILRHFGQDSFGSEANAKSLAVTMVTMAWTLMLEKNLNDRDMRHKLSSSWETVNAFETIHELTNWLIAVFQELCQLIAREQGTRHQSIISQLKRNIKDNYAEYQNIEDIVRPLYISASHANVIFKQHTGMTIFDYLLQTRIETAKSLLCEPSIKVYEVADRVGYKSIAYFGSTFKQHTGLTPKQYMDRYAKRRVSDNG